MKKPLEPRAIALYFGLTAVALACLSLASYWNMRRLVRSFDSVAQAHQALQTLQYIETLMESAESSVRGYVITGEAARLDPYRYAKLMVPVKMRDVKGASVKRLNLLLSNHLAYLSQTVAQRRQKGYEAAARWILTEDTSFKRDAMERSLSEAQKDQRAALRERSRDASAQRWKTLLVLLLAAGASPGLLAWVFGLLRRETAERRHAESATQRTETFLHSIIDRIPYMILVKEAQHLRLTLVNKAAEAWLGRRREELLNSNELDLRPRDEARAAIQKDRQVLGEGQLVDIPEEPLTLSGQEPRILHTQKIPVPDDQGNPAHLLTISEDITQRKQVERMLELSRDAAVESARLKSEFIRNMSHEIRTPLSIVVGMTSLLLDTELTPEQKRFAGTVKRAAEGLAALSKSILDFSKIEAGTFTLETREVNVRQVVEDVVAMLRDQAKAKGVSLVSLSANDIPTAVQGDPPRLRQVLTQLIGNAVKFTERGEVIVRLTEAKETGLQKPGDRPPGPVADDSQLWLHARITDTGIGIAEDRQKYLFEPFRQADGSYTRRFGGTGLGLAISKRIVELMGGEIGFESVPGQGSSFWCTIPFAKRHVHGPVVQVPSLPWARARVLVVDENETCRQMIEQQLGTWGLSCEMVSSGQTALEVLRREQRAGRPFPIVLLDMHLPDMDGVAFARAVKSDPALADTKLLVMTNRESPLDAPTSASLGFAGWVSKPPKPEELYERLAAVIEPQKSLHRRAA